MVEGEVVRSVGEAEAGVTVASREAAEGEADEVVSRGAETLDPRIPFWVSLSTLTPCRTYDSCGYSSEMGSFLHAVESEMLCSSTMPTKVPYFNAPIYLENKTQIGKVDEILGPINEVYFTVKMSEGMLASSFKKDDKVYIGGDKLLPIERFLPKPKAPAGEKSELPHVLLPYYILTPSFHRARRSRRSRWCPRRAGRFSRRTKRRTRQVTLNSNSTSI